MQIQEEFDLDRCLVHARCAIMATALETVKRGGPAKHSRRMLTLDRVPVGAPSR